MEIGFEYRLPNVLNGFFVLILSEFCDHISIFKVHMTAV